MKTMKTSEQQFRYVPVRVDGGMYCLDNRAVRSVSLGDDCELFEVELPGGIVGEIEFQGDDIPVFRLRLLLESNATPMPRREHLVIVSTEQGLCLSLIHISEPTRPY